MARHEGTLKLSSNIEPRVAAPLDARSKVATLVELTASGTFSYPYTGMEVYVVSEQKKYLLIGNDPTVSSNWIEIGTGSGITVMIDDELSTVSENPVQNKVITAPLNAATTKLTGINSTANNYIQMENGYRLYISNTEPFTVNIPEGSVGLGW